MGCGSSGEWKIPPPSNLHIVAKDHFSAGRQVGEGGFGKVYAVRHYETGAWYAMKDLVKRRVTKSNSVTMIFNERELLATVESNPFIINMHFAFQDAESCFLLMDLAMGGDLRFHMTRGKGRLEEPTFRFYILCIVFALEHLHSLRIVHRDVK